MKMIWTSCLAALAILAGVLDVLTTDLRHEANPALVAFGRSLENLILLKTLVSLVLVVGFYRGLAMLEARRTQVRPSVGPVSFLGWLFFKENASLLKLLLGWPRDWGAVLAVTLLGLGVTAVSGGLSAAVVNTLEAIHSQVGLVVFYLCNGLFAVGVGYYLAYVFLRDRQLAEPGASLSSGAAASRGKPKMSSEPPFLSDH